jgi:hypothetical protein
MSTTSDMLARSIVKFDINQGPTRRSHYGNLFMSSERIQLGGFLTHTRHSISIETGKIIAQSSAILMFSHKRMTCTSEHRFFVTPINFDGDPTCDFATIYCATGICRSPIYDDSNASLLLRRLQIRDGCDNSAIGLGPYISLSCWQLSRPPNLPRSPSILEG